MYSNKLIDKNILTLCMFFIGLVLIILAGFRPLEYFHDTENYLIMIHSFDNIWQTEPTFWIINQFNQLLLGGNDQIFFLIYAILGVTIKIIAINRLSSLPLLSVYLYICLYFVLHEMTQIRVGVACGIFLLAISDIVNKNFRMYLFKTLIAMAFHYSAIIMIIFYFFDSKRINFKIYFFIPISGLLILYIPSDIMLSLLKGLSIFLPEYIGIKLNDYLYLLENGVFNINRSYSLFTLSLLFLYYFILINVKKFINPINIVLIKIFSFYFLFLFSLSFIPVIAVRLSEFIGIILIILIPNCILIFKQRFFPSLLIIVWTGIFLYKFIISYLSSEI